MQNNCCGLFSVYDYSINSDTKEACEGVIPAPKLCFIIIITRLWAKH